MYTNADSTVTEAQRKKTELAERRAAFINTRYKKSEKDDLAGTQAPNIVFGFQRQDVKSTDAKIDNDLSRLRRMPMATVKQYNVTPDGTFATDFGSEGDAVYEAVKRGYFCSECTNAQPEMPESWEVRMQRLELHIGRRPAGAKHGTHCCYCGSGLGFQDVAVKDDIVGTVTPEQKRILETLYGPMHT